MVLAIACNFSVYIALVSVNGVSAAREWEGAVAAAFFFNDKREKMPVIYIISWRAAKKKEKAKRG